MKIEELIANEKVVWQCIDSDAEWIGTIISFDIQEKNGKSFITLRHMNWKEVTPFYRSCNYNWAFFLYSLKCYCEDGEGIPYHKRKF
ncbi:hypothetical protein [Cohnella cellulosilytica]|uniref:Uncharacterized protein n=1 Tax=Cohnella cellulosilytica TaxID=986710 RepID=A0ABW2FLJ0_9BACL